VLQKRAGSQEQENSDAEIRNINRRHKARADIVRAVNADGSRLDTDSYLGRGSLAKVYAAVRHVFPYEPGCGRFSMTSRCRRGCGTTKCRGCGRTLPYGRPGSSSLVTTAVHGSGAALARGEPTSPPGSASSLLSLHQINYPGNFVWGGGACRKQQHGGMGKDTKTNCQRASRAKEREGSVERLPATSEVITLQFTICTARQ